MTPEIEVVSGRPDESELAAIVALGIATASPGEPAAPQEVAEALQAVTGTKPPAEWVRRIRSGGSRTGRRTGARVPGVLSDRWAWSLRR